MNPQDGNQAGDQTVADPMGGAAPAAPVDPMGGSTEPVTPQTGGETSTEETTTETPDEANATPEATDPTQQAA